MRHEELAAWLRLTLTPGVGNETARKLLAAFGLPQAVFSQSYAALCQVVSRTQATQIQTEPAQLTPLLATTWEWLNATNRTASEQDRPSTAAEKPVLGQRRIVALGDEGYPASLLNMADPPLMLYMLGGGDFKLNRSEVPVNQEKSATNVVAVSVAERVAQCLRHSVAIVGSRNPTPQGLLNARVFAKGLSEAGITVVSGLALGIDGAAHEGALEGLAPDDHTRLATIAVVGTGLDRVYPKSHRKLAHAIASHGLIISEYPLGTPPLPENFPKRNRIIAGLAKGTLVVEAALKSGSLITARLAVEQGKEVFAIPGSILAGQSRGCHALIRQGAKLVECVQDILEEFEPPIATLFVAKNEAATRTGDEIVDETGLLKALGFDPVSLDALQARTGMDTPNLQAQLMTLELDGQVMRLAGGLFQRIAAV